jgi:hypothetical protein
MTTPKLQEKITVLRRIAVYEEAVFDSMEEFEHWKALMNWTDDKDCYEEEYEEFRQINENKFANIEYPTEEYEPTLYIAVKGDIRDCSDDWIHQNIFDEAVDDNEFESMPLIEGTWHELLFESTGLISQV